MSAKNTDYVNDRVQKKLGLLIKNFPHGLWCCDLQEEYSNLHKTELDFRDFGYTSLIQLVLELPETFRAYQPGVGDWILFDATVPETEEELQYLNKAEHIIPNSVKSELLKLLEEHRDIGVDINKIPDLYYKMYRKRLDFEDYGFYDMNSLLKSLKDDILHFRKVGHRIFVLPLEKKTPVFTNIDEDLNASGDAVPPIAPGDDLFMDLFPKNVFSFGEKILFLQLESYVEIGSIVDIIIGDVWSPHKFCVQLKEYEERLKEMEDNMQFFYKINAEKYKMPQVTIQPSQICAVHYSVDNATGAKWHRAEIIKITKKHVNVKLLDFGSTVSSKFSQLRFLVRDFGDLPAQAIRAALAYIEPSNKEKKWSNHTNKRFLELIDAPSMSMEVLDVNYEEMLVIIKIWETQDIKKININKILIKEKLAVRSEHLFNYCTLESLELAEKSSEKVPVEETKELNTDYIPPTRKPHTDAATRVPHTDYVPPSRKKPHKTAIGVHSPVPKAAENNEATSTLPPEENIPECSHPPQSNTVSAGATAQLVKILQTQVEIQALQQQLLQQIQQQQAMEKLQINNLAVQFFNTNPEIKNIAIVDPQAAMRVASNLARSYFESMKAAGASAIPTVPPAKEEVMNNLSENLAPLNIKERLVKEIELDSHKIHILNVNNENYCSVDRIINLFTPFSSRGNVDKILAAKKKNFEYIILRRNEHKCIFEELEGYNSFEMKEDEDELFLLQLINVVPFLESLTKVSGSIKNALEKLCGGI